MQLVCGQCGKRVSSRGGGNAMCPACGAVVQAPPPPGVSVPGNIEPDHVGFDYRSIAGASSSGAGGKNLGASPARPRGWVRWLSGVVVGSLIGVGAATLWWRERASPVVAVAQSVPTAVAWDVGHREELLVEKSRSDAQALAGNLQGAYDGYGRLLARVSNHDVTDPTVRQLSQAVQASQQSVFAALLREREETARAAVVPLVVPTGAAAAALPATVPTSAPLEHGSTPAMSAEATASATAAAAGVEPLLADAPIAPTTGPAPLPLAVHTYTLPDDITDAQVATALHRGALLLQRAFKRGQLSMIGPFHDEGFWNGLVTQSGIDALCVYALLHTGQALHEPWLAVNSQFTADMLAVLKSYPFDKTYHRSLRAAALAVYNRPEDFAALEEDVRWLVTASTNGAYTYGMPQLPVGTSTIVPLTVGGSSGGMFGRVAPSAQPMRPGVGAMLGGEWDNSNSQYGLLGVWSGAEAGVAVPAAYWQDVQAHWLGCQCGDGEWAYKSEPEGRLSMTDAGLASLLVTQEYMGSTGGLYAGISVGTRADQSIQNALDWLDAGDNATATIGTAPWAGYKLYGLERVGLASGFKFFGKHDWYAELARKLIYSQHADGSWGDDPPTTDTAIDTAYALLFLSRGRHPVLFNKLRFDGDWHDYPHDVANLAKFASYELQRPMNWQVINTGSDWPSWMDSPVLYIATGEPPHFSQAEMNQLRDYAMAGGLIFTHADRGSSSVTAWATRFAKELFPDYPLLRLPANHPAFSSLYDLKKPLPDLLGVSNGSRLLMVHSPQDMAQYWQHQWTDAGKSNYELALNLFIYANGKTGLHNRLETPYIPPFPGVPQGQTSVVRLSYGGAGEPEGAWNPEPYAWKRFRNYFQWETHRDVKVQEADVAELLPAQAPLAVLTGAAGHVFHEADAAAVAAYVRGGGVLLVDACGGSAAFASDAEALLGKAFPGVPLQPVTSSHPLLRAVRAGADDLTVPLLRPFAKDLARGQRTPPLQYLVAGGGQVIFSRLDLTSGLLGTNTYGINGYDPSYAAALVKNAVLWADARAVPPTTDPTTAPAAAPAMPTSQP